MTHFETLLIEAHELKEAANWFGHTVSSYSDLFTARRVLKALSLVSGSGCTMIEPEHKTTETGKDVYFVEYEPTTAMACAVCHLITEAARN